MKKSFKEIIDETFKDKESWDYYSDSDKDKNTFNDKPMLCKGNSEKFLKEFIELAGKAEKTVLFKEINKLGERATHVVSTFFIGHYIYKNTKLKDLIDKQIENIKPEGLKSDVSFPFVWFLTCLFHDLGYKIENFNRLKYSNFNDLLGSIENKLPKNKNGIPKFYNQIYQNYFKYRIKKHGKNDHGIVAAHLLYDSLFKIRKLAEKNPTKSQKKLCWEEKLLDIYNFCAWNILGHNIWFGQKNNKCDELIYSKYKIKRLLLEKDKIKINAKKYPFFFLFCLVDTIEPYKKILDYNSLDKVFLELNEDKIIISTDLKCSCGKSILESTGKLNEWLTKTSIGNNKVEVVIN